MRKKQKLKLNIENKRWQETDKQKYHKIREDILKRDKYTCVLCTKPKPKYQLVIHHIIRWADSVELRYMPGNICTLCHPCHAQVTGNEQAYISILSELIDKTVRPISTIGLGILLAKYSKPKDIKNIPKKLRGEKIEAEDETEI